MWAAACTMAMLACMLLTFLSDQSKESAKHTKHAARRVLAPCALQLLAASLGPPFVQDAVDRGWFREKCSIVTGVPDMRSILETIRDIAAGMAHMHERGVVHGDMTGGLQGQ